MNKDRISSFSDGFFTVVITLMVLQIKMPNGGKLVDFLEIIPSFLIYVITFIIIAVHWVNHHQLFDVIKTINYRIIWANFNFLFWLSLLPFATGWLGKNYFNDKIPIIIYTFLMLIVSISYKILMRYVMNNEISNDDVIKICKNDKRGNITILLNLITLIIAFLYPIIAFIILVLIKLSWAIPNFKIKKSR